MECQTVLITGGTSRLGLEIAIHYVNLGAASVIIKRGLFSKGNEAKLDIETRTARKDFMRVMILDMDTFAGVKAFVEEFRISVKTIGVVLLVSRPQLRLQTITRRPGRKYPSRRPLTILLGLLLLP